MTTLQQISNRQHSGIKKDIYIHQSFIATKTIAHVLAYMKPTLADRKLVDLPVTATIEQVFNLLLAEDILSVPVYQLENDTNKKIYLTVISVLDLIKLLSQHTSDITNSNFFHHQIKEIIGQTEETSRLVTVQYSDALVDVLHLFSEDGAHRVLVSNFDLEEQPPAFLSQMDLMRYLQAHNHHLGAILDATVPDLVQRALKGRQKQQLQKRQKHQVQTVTFKSTAINVFEQIAHDPFNQALPIVDDHGHLLGEISSRDLRGLNKTRSDDLSKPVLMFLKASRGELVAPITCHHRFTLSQVMAAFILRKTSRLWWIDQQGHVQGVITLTDVLGIFSADF